MQSPEELRLLQLLDERHSWPSLYAFKFIVPQSGGDALRAAMPQAERVDTRVSAGGKYTAYTFHCAMGSSREVLEVYARVREAAVPGLISL
jgi:hypothetical protein